MIFPMIHLTEVRLLSPVLDDVVNIGAETSQGSISFSQETKQRNGPWVEHQVISPLLVGNIQRIVIIKPGDQLLSFLGANVDAKIMKGSSDLF